jgi:two-component system KDP operon response regulator KdpE
MPSILLIKDEPRTRQLIRSILRASGHVVYEAGTGQEAIQSFTATPIDMVIVDIGLPDCHGVDLIRELQSLAPGVLVLVTSGNFENKDIRNAPTSALNAFCRNPSASSN